MPYIPHTPEDERAMLDAIGVRALADLFDEVPADLQVQRPLAVPPALGEAALARLMQQRAQRDAHGLCLTGAGAYDHHVPAVIWDLLSRGEFYSAYTPYQAEASQGTLQVIYEYQSMMTALTALDASNASLYDGASGFSEAVLMAVRASKRGTPRRVLVPASLHPRYRAVAHAVVRLQGIELVEVPVDPANGTVAVAALDAARGAGFAALAIPQPNFYGQLEDVDALTDWAHAQGALALGVVNPIALGLLKPPGQWGARGADIACGEGQPLGIPLSSGGPYFGFLCCRKDLVRQMPGRVVGRTTDLDGCTGYALTLQAREQHIRRSKATSNICTNQGLMMVAATIYLALMGAAGLRAVAEASHAQRNRLVARLARVPGVSVRYSGPAFHEAVVRLPAPVPEVLRALAAQGIDGGYDLGRDDPALSGCLLVCATEKLADDDIEAYAQALERSLGGQPGSQGTGG